MIRGNPRFDGLALGEGSFNFLGPTPALRVKAAFINNSTGITHGWTETGQGWSKDTMRALHELRESIERDLAATHLVTEEGLDASEDPTSPNVKTGAPQGIGEHLEGDEANQV